MAPLVCHFLPSRLAENPHVTETSKFPFLFAECRNVCGSKDNPNACQGFCDCIYKQGRPLNACLNEYHRAKKQARSPDPIR